MNFTLGSIAPSDFDSNKAKPSPSSGVILKFIHSEKVVKFCEISSRDLSHVVPIKSTVKNSQKFVAFSEYMNFTTWQLSHQIFRPPYGPVPL